jgi:hypothetical protein
VQSYAFDSEVLINGGSGRPTLDVDYLLDELLDGAIGILESAQKL